MSISMTGPVAVGIVIVDGPPGSSAAFTDDERLTIATEVSQGFDILYQLSGSAAVPVNPHVLFLAETQRVTLTTDPASIPAPTSLNPASADYSSRETPWRDAALQALGFPGGTAGVSAYIQQLLSKAWTVAVTPASAYVVFFTKYNTAWMGYSPSGLYSVLQFAWVSDKTGNLFLGRQGWGPENIDRVFAHETGHVAGAPDEYAQSNCNPAATFGPNNVPNGNCQTNPTVPAVDCLMYNDTSAMCQFTPKHWGWVSGPLPTLGSQVLGEQPRSAVPCSAARQAKNDGAL